MMKKLKNKRTNRNVRTVFFTLMGLFLSLLLCFCEKEEEINFTTNKIEFTSFSAKNIRYKTAEVSSIIPKNYGIKIDEYGHCWSLNSSPDVNDSCSIFTEYSSNSFTSDLLGLQHNTTYYVRSYFKIDQVVSYSKEISFKTQEIKVPEVKTTEITNLRAKTAESGGEVLNDNGGEVISRGVCWNTTVNPTIEDSLSLDSLGLGKFVSALSNLEIGTTYYLRAYATNEVGTGYGDFIGFVTKDGIPEISTQQITNLTALGAESGINISNDGGLEILEKGICYNRSGSPTVKDSTSFGGSGANSYHVLLENLDVNTSYHIRSFAINELDTIYGNEISFNTKDGIPEITTLEIKNITAEGAISGITISDDGGLDVLEKGVCYNMSGSPTLKDKAIFGGSGVEDYEATVENLNIDTTYYVRSFAINIMDTVYGNELIFNTLDGFLDVSSSEISEIGSTTANGGGEILNDEGLLITERGICWNLSGSPTVADQKCINGDGTGSFECNLENLEINTTYYVRAYAENKVGVSYGDEVSFTTHDGTPIIYKSIKEINPESAVIKMKIIDDYSSIIETGILWSNSSPVTDTDDKIIAGSSTGEYDVDITGLQQNQKYFVKAYAENSKGITYTEEFEFTTTEFIDGIEFAFVEGGTFTMGNDDGPSVEQPAHNVTLSSFKISAYEITNEQFCQFLNSINVNEDGTFDGIVYINSSITDIEYSDNSFAPVSGYEDYPADYMSWYAADHYCEWIGGRLPTEAEWEYAARGGINNGNNYLYSGSNDANEVGCIYNANDWGKKPIGTKLPNSLGIYDMTGNVNEWTQDWNNIYSSEPQTNPLGPNTGTQKIYRGGSYINSEDRCTVSFRHTLYPGNYAIIGIRVVIPE